MAIKKKAAKKVAKKKPATKAKKVVKKAKKVAKKKPAKKVKKLAKKAVKKAKKPVKKAAKKVAKKAAKKSGTRASALGHARSRIKKTRPTPKFNARKGHNIDKQRRIDQQIIAAYAAASRELAEWVAAARRVDAQRMA